MQPYTEIKMNKLYIFCVAALAVIATGCSSKKDIDMDLHDGQGLEFVHFEKAADSWLVTEDDESYVYDVVVANTYAHDEAVTYTVSVGKNTTGVEGTDFSIANKTVTIAKGEYLGKLPVTILYDTTGEGFELELVLSVDEKLVNPSYGDACQIVVKSDKVTIDWNWLAGKWSGLDASGGDAYAVTFTKETETTGVLNGLWGGGPLNFSVDFEKREISIPGNQYSLHNDKYETDLYFVAVDENGDPYADLTTPVVATMSPAGIVVSGYDFLLVGGPYDGYTWVGGESTTITR